MGRILSIFVLVAAGIVGFGRPAAANLILAPNADITGTGLGAVATIVTGHQDSDAASDPESACFGNGGSGDCEASGLPGGDEQTGTGGLQGCTSCQNLFFVLNISETGQDKNLTLLGLSAFFYNAANTLLYTAPLDPSLVNAVLTIGNGQGLGGSGFVFQLDAAQKAIVAGLAGVTKVGGGFSATNTNDGNDTLYVAPGSGVCTTCTPIPEPSSMLLLGTGLMGFGVRARRWLKRRQ